MTSLTPASSSRPRTVILTVLFAGAVLSGARLVHRGLATSSTAPVNGPQLFDNVRAHISKLYVDTLSDSSVYRMAVDGLMKELDEPGNAFLESGQHKPQSKAGHTVTAIQRVNILANAIGYVDLKAFNSTTPHDLTHTIDSLIQKGARALIIDVRADSSDSLDPAVKLSDLFLNPGQEAVHTKGRVAGSAHTYASQSLQRWPALPIAILVDRKTASAAELFAGALQDHDRAVIVGARTAGVGGSQTLYPVDDVGTLQLTTARWFTPSGRAIPKVPLPDDAQDGDSASEKKPTYKTDAGRPLVGGGGITPDVIAGDTSAHRRVSVKAHVPPQPATDTILVTAQQLLTGVRSPSELLQRATKLAASHKPST